MRRILIVEDSRTQAERLRLLLTREGYEVELASDGEEGLRKTNDALPDLIISDVTMPKMDGFAFCQAIKSSEATRWIPVILLTSRTSAADVIKGLEAGADNFIPKPYEDEYLVERVRRIVEQIQLRNGTSLDMEVVLTVGGRKIRVTADRQQIIELLFSTFEEMSKNLDQLAQANEQLLEARIEAERANRAKSQFLSRMSHELRTPLNAINGFAQLLETSDLSPEDLKSVQTIAAAGRHLLDLIDEVLDIGRIEADELNLSPEPVRVADVCQEVVHFIKPLAFERGIAVEEAPGLPQVHVWADRRRLKQVLLNLLSNAVKYNRDMGKVRLGWESNGDRVGIEVADTGKGIAEADLTRLFVPFDRIGAEQMPGVEGTGLGLALSKRFVEVMGGTLTATSDVGVGSTFRVELPIAHVGPVDAGEDGSRETAARPEPAKESEGTVVCIEDNEMSFRLVETLLRQRLGATALHASVGRDGLDLARRQDARLILLDVNLPDISGADVLELLKSDPATRHIPVIVLSADASALQAEHMLKAGAVDYVEKPIDLNRFVQTVSKHLQLESERSGARGGA